MRNQNHTKSLINLLTTCLSLALLTPALLPRADSAQSPFACDESDPQTGPRHFCNPRLPVEDRARDLVSRLTVDEKVSQLVNTAAAVPRLGVPAYQWWSEALHGVAFIDGVPQGMRFNGAVRSATSFPQVILTASSFDEKLWYRIGQINFCAPQGPQLISRRLIPNVH
ncbi:hypothetical protein RHMOL_Rhmol07G0258300 [Rhododendron molle]|uniref:Uncharacterized protein n=1 Tax=Rhododendron molle TaxID=49168 RepID=A0ACC0N503_RHOML|nr:hypothetical protein RHMOL_Rhmol07G0258300 [Rhododendron molle]